MTCLSTIIKKTFFFLQRGCSVFQTQAVACNSSSFEYSSPTPRCMHALTKRKESRVLRSWPLTTPAASAFMSTLGEHRCLWPQWMFTGCFLGVFLSPGEVLNYKHSVHSAHLISAEPVIIPAGIYPPLAFPVWLNFKGVDEQLIIWSSFSSQTDILETELSTLLQWQYSAELEPADFSLRQWISKYKPMEQRDKKSVVCFIKQETFVTGCCYI